jgi:hypothetical protein
MPTIRAAWPRTLWESRGSHRSTLSSPDPVLRVKKAVRAFLKVFLVLVLASILISAAVSLAFRASFGETVITLLLFGGVAILGLAAVTGAGFAEYGYYGSRMMYVSSHYAKTITADRPRRRKEQTEGMVVGAILGVGLIGIAALLAWSPWLALIPIVGMIVAVYGLGRSPRRDARQP